MCIKHRLSKDLLSVLSFYAYTHTHTYIHTHTLIYIYIKAYMDIQQ